MDISKLNVQENDFYSVVKSLSLVISSGLVVD